LSYETHRKPTGKSFRKKRGKSGRARLQAGWLSIEGRKKEEGGMTPSPRKGKRREIPLFFSKGMRGV